MKKFIIITILYFLVAFALINNFNDDIFVTDKQGTTIILSIIYIGLAVIYGIFKFVKKLLNKKSNENQ